MPYIITVLAFIVIGVGFTLFNNPTQTLTSNTENQLPIESPLDSEIADSISTFKDSIEELIDTTYQAATNTASVGVTPDTTTRAENPTASEKTQPVTATSPVTAQPTDFKNGTYSSQVSYRTPDGNYQLNLSMTISNDTVTNSNVSFDSKGARDSYSKRFLNSYSSQVTNKDLSQINLSRVGGASLTTKAFNNAVISIEQQAAS